jgi:hypothetical protein
MRDKRRDGDDRLLVRAALLLVQILIPGVLLLVGLVLTKPYSRWLIAGLAVGFAVVASTVVALLMSRYYTRHIEGAVATHAGRIEELASKRLAAITEAVFMRPGGRDSWTPEQLSVLEGEIAAKTIWIVGENFDSEVSSAAPFRDVVKHNIHVRGIKYVYIAPDDEQLVHLFNGLREELGIADDDVRFRTVFLEAEEWRKVPYTVGNFTIYDPARPNPKGYSWDPGGDGKSFIMLLPKVALAWVSKLEKLRPELKSTEGEDLTGQDDGKLAQSFAG